MIKRLFTALLACLMLLGLAACGSPDTSQETIPPTSPPEETAAPAQPTDTVQENAAGEDVLQIQWDTGNRILLLEELDMSVYLCKDSNYGNIAYDIEVRNDRAEEIRLDVTNIFFNDHIMVNSSLSATAEPGAWGGCFSTISFPVASMVGELDRIHQLSFKLELRDNNTYEVLLTQDIQVDVTGTASLKAYQTYPDTMDIQGTFMEFCALEEQLLMEKDGLRVSLLRMGKPVNGDSLNYIYRVENTSDQWRQFSHGGTAVNDVYLSAGSTNVDIRPGSSYYNHVYISDLLGMERIGSVQLGLGVAEADSETSADIDWYTVEPQSAASNPTPVKEGRQLLLEEQGLRVSLKEETDDYSGNPLWTLVVVNDTDQNLRLEPLEIILGEEQAQGRARLGVYMSNRSVGAHQTAVINVTGNGELPVSFRLEAWDFSGTQVLFTTEGRVELTPASE